MKSHPLALFRYCPRCGSTAFTVADSRSKRCADCHFTYYANASASAAAVVCNAQGELLLVRRAFAPAAGTLCFPGGFTEHGESLETTCLRELQEETGLHGHAPKFLFSLPNLYVYSELTVHTLDSFFAVSVDDETALFADDDASAAEWHPLSPDLLDGIALSSHREALRRLLKNS